MKIFVSGITIYFICILVITANAQTEEKEIFIVHPAVGKKIDITERKVFGLFPRVESFRSATVYRSRDGIFTLEVEKRVGRQYKILSRKISRKEINELSLHIEYFNNPQKGISLDIKPDSVIKESLSYDDYGKKSILPRDEFEAPNFTFLVIMGTLGGIVVGTIGLIGG
ncbi:MAG: hypothetical protein GY855_06295, partial [candidate division Zixibacteria bacterium]|nr:hypothetical protein [candidate division Zixibacteria bacterium]